MTNIYKSYKGNNIVVNHNRSYPECVHSNKFEKQKTFCKIRMLKETAYMILN